MVASIDQRPKPAPAPHSKRSPEKKRDSQLVPPAELVDGGSELCISFRAIETLTPYAGNARVHSRVQIKKLKESIEAFGFLDPILINSSGTIIAGHGRIQAAKLLGMTEVPTICLDNLTPDQVRAYVLADNRLAEDGRMGLLKNMVSTAALVHCTHVINTFHSSIHAAFLSIVTRSTHEMRCEP